MVPPPQGCLVDARQSSKRARPYMAGPRPQSSAERVAHRRMEPALCLLPVSTRIGPETLPRPLTG